VFNKWAEPAFGAESDGRTEGGPIMLQEAFKAPASWPEVG